MSKLTIYSQMVKDDFNRALRSAIPPDVTNAMRATTVKTATGRKVSQAWLAPLANPAEFDGIRHYQQLDHRLAEIEIKAFDIANRQLIRDVNDSQVPLWEGIGAEMVRRMQLLAVRRLNTLAAAAESSLSFEGVASQYMAAHSHTVGMGDNLIATTCATGSALDVVALYIGGPIKPLIWYQKKDPILGENDAADQSETGWLKQWVDGEGVEAPGFWWDMVYDAFTGKPTVAEFQTGLGEILAAFRTFTYPGGDYVHELTQFNKSNLLLMIPSSIEVIARRVRDNAVIANSDNEYAGTFDYQINTNL